MSKAEQEVKVCEACGASIYPEHIKKQTADYWFGKLLCPHCLQEKRLVASVNPAAAYADSKAPVSQEPIALTEADELPPDSAASNAPATIRAFGGGPDGSGGVATPSAAARPERLHRALQPKSPNATRCRTFHGKLNDASLAYMNEQINEWADSGDDIEIKFATTCIGVIEGKHADPHLIVTVFY